LPRGFDWSDEAWSISLIASNRITLGEPWGFHHLLHNFFEVTGGSILVFRFLRLFGYLSLAAISVFVIYRISVMLRMHISVPSWLTLVSLSQIGFFIVSSYAPRNLGYNELASWFSQAFGLIFLYLVAKAVWKSSRSRTDYLLVGVMGLILSLSFAAKFTTFVPLLALALLLPLSSRMSIRTALHGFFVFSLGAFLGFALLFLMDFPLIEYLATIRTLLFDSAAQDDFGHPISGLLMSYLASVLGTFSIVLPLVTGFSVFWGVFFLYSKKPRGFKLISWIIALFAVAINLWGLANLPREFGVYNYLGFFIGYLLLSVLVAYLVILLLKRSGGKREESTNQLGSKVHLREILVSILIIVSTPLAAAFGTNNPFMGQLIFSSTLWVSLFGFLVLWLLEQLGKLETNWLAIPGYSFVLAPLILVSFAVSSDITIHPYRTLPYVQQTIMISTPPFQGMLLTQGEVETIEWLNGQDGVAEGEFDTISLLSPGHLLALNNSGFVNPWIFPGWPASISSISKACFARDVNREIVLIVPHQFDFSSDFALDVQDALDACGLNMFLDFSEVGRLDPSESRAGVILLKSD